MSVPAKKEMARLRGRQYSRECEDLAGEKGFEPLHAGIKIQCLNQLGDSPTQVGGQKPPTDICRIRPQKRSDLLGRPAHEGMDGQIAALANLPARGRTGQFHIMRHCREHRTS